MPLVAAICPSCAGHLELDDSLETAFCMYCGGTVLIRPVQTDQPTIDNYLKLLIAEVNSGNYSEAESYCNKILEINPEDAEVWLLKGDVIFRQSTAYSLLFDKAQLNWDRALALSDESQKDDVYMRIGDTYRTVLCSLVRMRTSSLPENLSGSEYLDYMKFIEKILDSFSQYQRKNDLKIIGVMPSFIEAYIQSLSVLLNDRLPKLLNKYRSISEVLDVSQFRSRTETFCFICQHGIEMQKICSDYFIVDETKTLYEWYLQLLQKQLDILYGLATSPTDISERKALSVCYKKVESDYQQWLINSTMVKRIDYINCHFGSKPEHADSLLGIVCEISKAFQQAEHNRCKVFELETEYSELGAFIDLKKKKDIKSQLKDLKLEIERLWQHANQLEAEYGTKLEQYEK